MKFELNYVLLKYDAKKASARESELLALAQILTQKSTRLAAT